MKHTKQQRGIGMIGFLFVAIVLSVVGLVVLKLLPFYQEYAGIQRSMEQLKQVPDLKSSSDTEIMRQTLNKFYLNDVREITGENFANFIKIEPVENTFVLKVDYEREAPLFSNIYITAKFKAEFKL